MILKPCLTAYSMPSIASDVEPLPFEFMNLTASSFDDQQVPDDADVVVAAAGDDAGDVRAVAVVVLAGPLALDRVEP